MAHEGAPADGPVNWERFRRLVAYYVDVIREDHGSGARFYLSDAGRKFLEWPSEREWCSSDTSEFRIEVSEANSRFVAALRQARATAGLYYGYPLYADCVTGSGGEWSRGFAVPVLLQAAEYEIADGELRLSLVLEWPRVNLEFLRHACRTPEEHRNFLQVLGLFDAADEPPPDVLTQIALRVCGQFPSEGVMEPLEPTKLCQDPPVREIAKQGFYNRALLVLGDRPPYTRGLERELPRLRDKCTDDELARSALRLLFGGPASGCVSQGGAAPAEPDAGRVSLRTSNKTLTLGSAVSDKGGRLQRERGCRPCPSRSCRTIYGRPWNHCCRPSRPGPRVAVPGCPTGHA